MQVFVSPEINQILDTAAAMSMQRGHCFVGVEHLLHALLEKATLLPRPITDQYLNTLQTVARELDRETWKGAMPPMARDVFYTPRCVNAANDAAKFAQRLSNSKPQAGHLLLAILADAHAAPSRVMDHLDLGRGVLIKRLRKALATSGARRPAKREVTASRSKGATETTSAVPGSQSREAGQGNGDKPHPLEAATRDLTRAARLGELEPAIGRDKEIVQLLEVLARKNKNNVILVGEAGVGKTKIIEGLAVAGVRDGIGGLLADHTILDLNLAAVMSGTQYRGAFEEKLQALIDELKRSKKTILFIDEIHLIVGAGATEGGGMDMANLLKPALARGEIRCIGATTLEEYRKFIEKDPALERRFQMLRVEPLSGSATWEVLKALRPSLERHHGVKIGRRAMHAAITLSQRYMPGRHLPDKAIDVLDQACARHRLKALAAKTRPEWFDSDLEKPLGEKITPHDIRKVVSQITTVPIEEITAEERARLGNLDRKLKRLIVGQDEAIAKAVAAVKKSRAGLSDPRRPNAVMLFLGPTGVGKTQLAKALADYLFGSAEHLITFAMSEYVEAHSVARLLGAPPGYVGHEEEGRLTAAVRNRPFSMLLFDEIEKAHPRVFDILLPVLDEGSLKDARGRQVTFRHCIIIFTSNIGAQTVRRPAGGEDRRRLMDELRRHFRPEFINRIDEIVPFYPLLFEDIRTILEISLKELQGRLKEKGIGLHVYQGAYEHLAEQGYDPEFGVRELQRTVERLVANPISTKLLENQFQAGDTIYVLMENGRLTFRKRAPADPEKVRRT